MLDPRAEPPCKKSNHPERSTNWHSRKTVFRCSSSQSYLNPSFSLPSPGARHMNEKASLEMEPPTPAIPPLQLSVTPNHSSHACWGPRYPGAENTYCAFSKSKCITYSLSIIERLFYITIFWDDFYTALDKWNTILSFYSDHSFPPNPTELYSLCFRQPEWEVLQTL